jgi:hypothetical protein
MSGPVRAAALRAPANLDRAEACSDAPLVETSGRATVPWLDHPAAGAVDVADGS